MGAQFNYSDSKENNAREKFAMRIKCRCGQIGSAVWEEDAGLYVGGARPVPVLVSNGFYMRVQKKDPGRTEIVCAVCESVVRD